MYLLYIHIKKSSRQDMLPSQTQIDLVEAEFLIYQKDYLISSNASLSKSGINLGIKSNDIDLSVGI